MLVIAFARFTLTDQTTWLRGVVTGINADGTSMLSKTLRKTVERTLTPTDLDLRQ
jgi:hypothetical protein